MPGRTRRRLFLLGLTLIALAVLVWVWPHASGLSARRGPSGAPELSVVLAARDIEYCGPATPCGPGKRTDTIFYVRVTDGRAWAVAIPRDTYVEVDGYGGKINAVYGYEGPEGLARAVEQVLGVRVDYYAIITLDLAARAVDAVGGVDVYLPAEMNYDDNAANLHIHIPAGRQHLDGQEAVGYMRFRGWVGDDLSRLDRIKEVVLQVMKRALSPANWPRVPGMVRDFWNDLETDLDVGQALSWLPQLRGLEIKTATLPTREEGIYLVLDPEERRRFLRAFMGVDATEAVAPPEARVLLLDGSGAGLGETYAKGLERLGLKAPEVRRIRVQDVSKVLVDTALEAGNYYAEAVHLPLVTRFRLYYDADVVIVLGRDLVP
ncbi:LCP family protein [Oceanithermus sp.]